MNLFRNIQRLRTGGNGGATGMMSVCLISQIESICAKHLGAELER